MIEILLKFPPGWPRPAVAVLSMAVLAVLDFVGAFAAAEWVARRSTVMMVVGAMAFVALFWFYASALQYAELALVTFGWIVFLQVGLLLLDRFRYGVQLPAGKWLAVMVIVAAQMYLIFMPNAAPREASQPSVVADVADHVPRMVETWASTPSSGRGT